MTMPHRPTSLLLATECRVLQFLGTEGITPKNNVEDNNMTGDMDAHYTTFGKPGSGEF